MIEKVIGKTPSGGDFSTALYIDNNGKSAKNKDDAVKVVINEYKNNGDLIQTTYANL